MRSEVKVDEIGVFSKIIMNVLPVPAGYPYMYAGSKFTSIYVGCGYCRHSKSFLGELSSNRSGVVGIEVFAVLRFLRLHKLQK